MSTNSLDKLQNGIDKNLSWRKKELTNLKMVIDMSEGSVLLTLLRSGITLLYAHWEGFIKISAREYLYYLNSLKLNCFDMTDNFLTLTLKPMIIDVRQSNKSTSHYKVVDKILNGQFSIFNVNVMEKLIIDTESNLSYKVLEDILFNLGLDSTQYQLKEHYIKNKLLDTRNKIAHGEFVPLIRKKNNIYEAETEAKEDWNSLYKEILELMELFKKQILDAAQNEYYLKKNK
ncbi:hypothetical protein IR152_06280 [Clostridioides sp. ES-S-0108-01]|uniref:MAE_28990/MAE_18760 family HEPN-like nuclease n=1 Tax=Clostridioides sp. ES-S-0108-01 TaxID=2770773 RepID=UPI001D0CD811|nr:hypothetical protein [Clostridioides sp. ES-S-0108-01]UDN50744.1 hypothetical protein JJC16_15575 [Clostridioides sp. ES-S-0107-01]